MVIGIAMVRDEADIIEATLDHMHGQVDGLLIADNGSTDGTRGAVIQRCAGWRDDPELGYFQSRKMTALAREAAGMGATWVVPFDADELWLSRDGRPIRDVLNELPEHVLIAQADLWDHVATAEDPDDENPVRRLGWRRPYPAPLPKVAVRPLPGLTIAQGNHSASYARHDLPGTVTNLLTIRHYPYRSEAQTLRKIRNGAAAYAATDLPSEQGAHWRQWGAFSDEQIGDLFRKWHWRERPAEPLCIDGEQQSPLVYDPAPMRTVARLYPPVFSAEQFQCQPPPS